MIVRDEVHALPRTLESVRGVVDRWTILDTGSVDGTKDFVLRAIMQEKIVGQLYEEPFVNYAHSRNRALDFAQCLGDEEENRPRYVLSLSADERLVGGDKLRAFLESYTGTESAFLVEVRTPTNVFPYPRVLRNNSEWRYEGEIHEQPKYLADPTHVPTVTISDCWIEYEPTDPERFEKRLRERDLPLLRTQFKSVTGVADKSRLLILLATTHESIADIVKERDSFEWYEQEIVAFGYYMLAIAIAGAPVEAVARACFSSLNIVQQLIDNGQVSIYGPAEMLTRFRLLAKVDPANPALAYMEAEYTAGVEGAQHGLRAAYRAARIAQDAVHDPEHAHDPHGLLWRSHLLAVRCNKMLKHGPAVKKSAEAAVMAGAPREVWNGVLTEAEIETLYKEMTR